jgi:hypothetical protein
MPDFTDAERDTLRTAALGSIVLVSQADPGVFATVKETIAGTGALARAPLPLATLLREGGLPKIPKGDRAALESSVLAALRDSVNILSRDPAWLTSFRQVVREAVARTASASHGVAETEAAMITRIDMALES